MTTLIARTDAILNQETALFARLWSAPAGGLLLLGLTHDVTRAFDAAITRQRVGARLFWQGPSETWGLGRPRAYINAGLHAVSRHREGQPFVIAGIGTDIDLF